MTSQPDTATIVESREETGTRRVPPYNVILENDDYHSFSFVIDVLRKALGYSEARAFQLMELAHTTGRSVVWTGTKEVAELKADQIGTFHETLPDGTKLGPLGCTIEPAPG
jgi:ATP-dependent Clp protease adaptor protein ClpS